eukprot:TRINITY_DN45_c0_g1_i1.p1 TRINITY_DN45_c0_g1~~TRINITY_DN45_c0_g1_i1.p1  ORF type:complete len:379 (-),score=24.99 TRINITY_DN45_c0_g1_i1:159-1295(-)
MVSCYSSQSGTQGGNTVVSPVTSTVRFDATIHKVADEGIFERPMAIVIQRVSSVAINEDSGKPSTRSTTVVSVSSLSPRSSSGDCTRKNEDFASSKEDVNQSISTTTTSREIERETVSKPVAPVSAVQSAPVPLYSDSDLPHLLHKENILRDVKQRMIAERSDKCRDALHLFTDKKNWNVVGTNKGVFIEKSDVHNTLPMIRGTLNFGKITPWELVDFLRDWEAKKKWDDSYSKGACLCEFDYYHAIVWTMYKGIMMYDSRDFVQACYTHVVKPGTVLQLGVSTTIYPEPVLPKKKSVRADLINGGFLMDTLPNGTLQVTFVAQVDLKVKAPASVIARMAFFLDQPLCLAHVKAAIDRDGVRPRPNRPTSYDIPSFTV